MATTSMPTFPARHSRIEAVAMAVTCTAFIVASDTVKPVVSRSCRLKAPVWSSTASCTKRSSSRAEANSFTVRMLV